MAFSAEENAAIRETLLREARRCAVTLGLRKTSVEQLTEDATHERVAGDEGGGLPLALGSGAFAGVEQGQIGGGVAHPRLAHDHPVGHGADHVRSTRSLH